MAYIASRPFTTPPSLADIEAMARECYAGVPDSLRRHCEGVVVQVQDFPDDETMEAMDCESPFDLLGLYQGVDLTRRSVGDQPEDVDTIFLYRRPILDYWCETEESLMHVVRHVLIHEIGHHFGFSDDDMDRIEGQVS
ncbi:MULTISPECIES: metallopeptidase family protein [Limibacillus]|jgi:predicted Zn-dependent protease with MMP-like domain|uniref:Putative Zn-dependent protease with MMP-like domain n=1 Tax=Limibacillus halophilus TaxID=1579333 RepID=A0A839STG4_9PROT|nr:metallopeptidase family protein [Limibacillus halophilus]MBB3065279.1 putative Zn-dependent protease with MMP-like domain [Limibacillus halophilus]